MNNEKAVDSEKTTLPTDTRFSNSPHGPGKRLVGIVIDEDRFRYLHEAIDWFRTLLKDGVSPTPPDAVSSAIRPIPEPTLEMLTAMAVELGMMPAGDPLVVQWIPTLKRQYLAALKVAAALAEAEPVAWAYYLNGDGDDPALYSKRRDLGKEWKEVPLYAAPIAPSPEETALSPSQLEQANVDLATESATIRGVLSELVDAIEAMDNLDEMDGDVFQTNSAALDAAVERAKPFTEAALLRSTMDSERK